LTSPETNPIIIEELKRSTTFDEVAEACEMTLINAITEMEAIVMATSVSIRENPLV
jgi:hypothetical protein